MRLRFTRVGFGLVRLRRRRRRRLLPQSHWKSAVFHRRQSNRSFIDAMIEVENDRIKRRIDEGQHDRLVIRRLKEFRS